MTTQLKNQDPLSADGSDPVRQPAGGSSARCPAMQSMQASMQSLIAAIMQALRRNLIGHVDPGARHPGTLGDGRRDRRCRRRARGHDAAAALSVTGLDRRAGRHIHRHTGGLGPDLLSSGTATPARRHRRGGQLHDRRHRHRRRQDPGPLDPMVVNKVASVLVDPTTNAVDARDRHAATVPLSSIISVM